VLFRSHRTVAVGAHPVAVLGADRGQVGTRAEDAAVAVLHGAGGVFCSGADLTAIGTEHGNRVSPDGDGPMGVSRLRLAKPVIAAVAGYAVAGGLELALWCDLRVADETAVFGVFCRRWGVPLIDGGTVRLPRLIGTSRAMDMILTGRAIDAEEAHRIGLVVRVVPDGEVVDAALETAELIAGNSPWGVRMTKEVMWSQLEISSLQAGIDLENRTQVLSSFTGDMQEAMAAFLEKRPPSFTNE